MVGIEHDDATFNFISRRCTPEIVLSRKKSFYQNSASKVANWITVDILKYFNLNFVLSIADSRNSFLLEIKIIISLLLYINLVVHNSGFPMNAVIDYTQFHSSGLVWSELSSSVEGKHCAKQVRIKLGPCCSHF